MNSWLVLIEPTATGFSAYAPDVPGCVAVGESVEAVRRNMRDALASHLRMLADEGDAVPRPTTQSVLVQV